MKRSQLSSPRGVSHHDWRHWTIVAAAWAGVLCFAPPVRAQTPASLLTAPSSVEAQGFPLLAPRPSSSGHVAVSLDVGLPEGLIGSLVIRPIPWLRTAVGAGSNGVAAGFRGGISLVPWGTGPSLTIEGGRSSAGGLSHTLSFLRANLSPDLFNQVSYNYANLHAGLDLGTRRWVFFLHAGLSYVDARLGGSGAALERQLGMAAHGDTNTSVAVSGDATIRAFAVSGKLGFLVFLD